MATVECKEARSGLNDQVMTKEGEKLMVVNDHWGPTSSRFPSNGRIPTGVLTFDSQEKAEAFASAWKGHPWYCIPKKYEILKVELVFKQEPDYYKIGVDQ